MSLAQDVCHIQTALPEPNHSECQISIENSRGQYTTPHISAHTVTPLSATTTGLQNLRGAIQTLTNSPGALSVLVPTYDRVTTNGTVSMTRPRHDQSDPLGASNSLEDELPVTLEMRDVTLTIPSEDIPEPLPLRCNGKFENIVAIWDDDPVTWRRTSPLRIQGVSIPVMYWRELYQYRRTKQWSVLKRRWWDYKVRTYCSCITGARFTVCPVPCGRIQVSGTLSFLGQVFDRRRSHVHDSYLEASSRQETTK